MGRHTRQTNEDLLGFSPELIVVQQEAEACANPDRAEGLSAQERLVPHGDDLQS
jgi:hypothetical protein